MSLAYPLTPSRVAALVRESVPVAPVPCATPRPRQSHGSVIAIGSFDGLHLGHRELVGACVREAQELGAASVVVTFDPDPCDLLVGPQVGHQLLSVPDRVSLCRTIGVDRVEVLPFTHELASQTPRAFVNGLVELLGPVRTVHVGENFHFGTKGAGTVHTLEELGKEFSFAVREHPLLRHEGQPVSSTRIRTLIGQGNVAQAADLLGRHHFVRGTVAHGRGEGTKFGFPTANVRCKASSCMPPAGVYACLVTDGRRAWPAAANVGMPPTFSSRLDACFLEANLIGFEGDLYDSELSVIFLEWLRASRPFSSLEELERVVLGNIDWVRCNVGCEAVGVSA